MCIRDRVYTDGGDPLYVMDQLSDKKCSEEHWIEDISLNEAMKRLPERERHIIDMRFFEGKTQTEVAEEIQDVYKRQRQCKPVFRQSPPGRLQHILLVCTNRTAAVKGCIQAVFTHLQKIKGQCQRCLLYTSSSLLR